MTLHADIDNALSCIEQQCRQLAGAVPGGEPAALQEASEALRRAAVDFSRLLDALPAQERRAAPLRQRLQQLAAALSAQRTGLLRRGAVVDAALHAMMPATRQTTYAAPYAAAGRASGAFKPMAA